MRNDLLADIVTASGGTITDHNNRNLLLKDWLDAVKAPAVNYVARLNGTDQYWQLSAPIVIPDGANFRISFTFKSFSDGAHLLSNNLQGALNRVFIEANKIDIRTPSGSNPFVFSHNESVVHIDVVRIDGVVGFFADDTELQPSGSVLNDDAININNVGDIYAAATSLPRLNGWVSNLLFEVDGVITHSIPLTNKAQGATQLATVGNVNATMVGYNNNVWEQV